MLLLELFLVLLFLLCFAAVNIIAILIINRSYITIIAKVLSVSHAFIKLQGVRVHVGFSVQGPVGEQDWSKSSGKSSRNDGISPKSKLIERMMSPKF